MTFFTLHFIKLRRGLHQTIRSICHATHIHCGRTVSCNATTLRNIKGHFSIFITEHTEKFWCCVLVSNRSIAISYRRYGIAYRAVPIRPSELPRRNSQELRRKRRQMLLDKR